MIISLRGTNGAGKSTIVRKIMALYPRREEVRVPGRRHPAGYRLSGLLSPLFIPGHYEPSTLNGGIDTLRDLDDAYGMIWREHVEGFNVLYEGKNMSDGTSRLCGMFTPEQAVIVVIDHPLSECIFAVRDRGHSIRVETIQRLHRKQQKDALAFKAAGYSVHQLGRDEALQKVRELLEI